MRIAYISYEFPPDSCNGGIATYVAQAANMLANAGNSVEVFAASPTRQVTEVHGGLTVHWLMARDPEHFSLLAGHAFACRNQHSRFDVLEGPEYRADARTAVDLVPDMPLVVKMHTPYKTIVQLNDPPRLRSFGSYHLRQLAQWTSAIARRQRPLPWTWDYNEHVVKWDQLERSHVASADIVASPSRSLYEFANREWGVPLSKLRLSPYPYLPAEEMLSIDTNSANRRVAYVGRLERRKGIELLAGAIPIVLKHFPDTIFELVGATAFRMASKETYESWLRGKLAKYQRSIIISGKVSLEGVYSVYQRSQVCVFPSIWENFPNVCLEAMSAGRAIVGSSNGGMSDMLADGECGMLLRKHSVRELAEKIIVLLSDEHLRSKLGIRARDRVLNQYNQDKVAEMMLTQYREAISLRNGIARTV